MFPILYINLDERTDRRASLEAHLTNYDIERVAAIKHEEGFIGCALSHIKCLQIALQRNYDIVCIIEDDFTFVNNNNFNNIILPPSLYDYDILLLCNRIRDREQIDENFSRVYECSWTSGHLIKRNLFEPLIANLQESIELIKNNGEHHNNHLDIYWNKLFRTDFVAITHNHLFATQAEGYSDIVHCIREPLPNLINDDMDITLTDNETESEDEMRTSDEDFIDDSSYPY